MEPERHVSPFLRLSNPPPSDASRHAAPKGREARRALAATCAAGLLLAGCAEAKGDDLRPTPDPDGGVTPAIVGSYEDVFETGFVRYAGTPQVEPTEVKTYYLSNPTIDVHHFSGEDRGPLCMYGGEFFVETREGDSDVLMIFLQGGGVCLDEICAATPDPILSLQLFSLAQLVGIGGVLDPSNEDNPTRDFDVVNAPYCDGSLFIGDVDRVLSDGNPDNGTEDQAYQRGLQNLTATLETAKRAFPNPSRIVLMGSSGGAYGVIGGTVMTRYYYPDTPLLVVSDSGAPIVNGEDPSFIQSAIEQINAVGAIPDTCIDCLGNGHTTRLLEWAMSFDDDLQVAYMTHSRDHVIGEFFMGTTAEQFERAVVEESAHLLELFPGRAFRFVIPGSTHTLAMGLDDISPELQNALLGGVGGLGFGFVGDDVDSEELGTWVMGGMYETGTDVDGSEWTAFEWLDSVINRPSSTPDILQLE